MTTAAHTRTEPGSLAASPARVVAVVFGVVFLATGLLGFVPGATSNLDDIRFLGHESGAELLGLFQVSIFHNLVHALFGVLGLAAARAARTSTAYLVGGGIFYLVLTAFGLVTDPGSALNFVPVNRADDLLHLALGVSMVGLGAAVRSRAPAAS